MWVRGWDLGRREAGAGAGAGAGDRAFSVGREVLIG